MTYSNSGALRANVVDVMRRTIMDADVRWQDGRIVAVDGCGPPHRGQPYLVPGFIDAHIHIESSLLPPAEFARIAVRHGTVACVSDPDEMANVLGVDGVHWMLANAAKTPFHFLFGVPVDGHAPGPAGDDVLRHATAGTATDHECATLAEAGEKIRAGMKVLIREGSVARNFDALHPLIGSHPGEVMFCSDRRHPDDLVRGHISQLAARAVGRGHDIFAVLQAACITPQWHYGMPLGQLRVGDAMNAALVHDLARLRVLGTWVDGRQVAENGETLLPKADSSQINHFVAIPVAATDLQLPAGDGVARVIVVEDEQLSMRELQVPVKQCDGVVLPSVVDDLLLFAMVNRYRSAAPVLALVRGFGLQRGALASSVSRGAHNIVAVGCDAASIAAAVNTVIAAQGGLAAVTGEYVDVLPLPIAGLMSDAGGDQVAAHYATLNDVARQVMGSSLHAPFMTLSGHSGCSCGRDPRPPASISPE